MSRIKFTSLLLCSTAIISTPAMADASLDELKAKLERAEKENIILKTEKLERDNITMKLEKIEAENAALRNETKLDKTPTASIPSQKTAGATANIPAPETKTIARREPIEASVPTPREHVAARKEINHALDNIPKDDARREMTAAYKAPKEEVPVVVKQWQGVYVGINAGYAANNVSSYNNSIGLSSSNNENVAVPSLGRSMTTSYYSGPVVGGQVGYNYEFNNHVVAGGEIDLDYADINNNSIANSPAWSYTLNASNNSNNSNITSNSQRTGLNWVGTARLRLGYALGNFLPYITGGFAYGSLSTSGSSIVGIGNAYNLNTTNAGNFFSGNVGAGSYSSTNLGWVLGAGAEYKVSDNWSVRGEYLFTQLTGLTGQTTSTQAVSNACCSSYAIAPAGTVYTNSSMGAFGVHQARVGLNYHTGWLGSASTIATKY